MKNVGNPGGPLRADDPRALLQAVREFVCYGMCRQANQRERNDLARRFAELAEKYKPLLTSRGVDPSQMSQVDFDELVEATPSETGDSITISGAMAIHIRSALLESGLGRCHICRPFMDAVDAKWPPIKSIEEEYEQAARR